MIPKCPCFFPPHSYHDRSFSRQKSDLTIELLQRTSIASATCVVDVGCGAGQTLRIVEELCATVPLIGVDVDTAALELGRLVNERIHFLKGLGEQLPIAEATVSHIISRVALNYMHQERSLREMARVLKPGGRMLISVHALGYSLQQVIYPQTRGWRQRAGNLKDVCVGLWLQLFGVQPVRTTFWGRSVPHSSIWRLRRQLRKLSCDVTHVQSEARFMGATKVWWVIIEKSAPLESTTQ